MQSLAEAAITFKDRDQVLNFVASVEAVAGAGKKACGLAVSTGYTQPLAPALAGAGAAAPAPLAYEPGSPLLRICICMRDLISPAAEPAADGAAPAQAVWGICPAGHEPSKIGSGGLINITDDNVSNVMVPTKQLLYELGSKYATGEGFKMLDDACSGAVSLQCVEKFNLARRASSSGTGGAAKLSEADGASLGSPSVDSSLIRKSIIAREALLKYSQSGDDSSGTAMPPKSTYMDAATRIATSLVSSATANTIDLTAALSSSAAGASPGKWICSSSAFDLKLILENPEVTAATYLCSCHLKIVDMFLAPFSALAAFLTAAGLPATTGVVIERDSLPTSALDWTYSNFLDVLNRYESGLFATAGAYSSALNVATGYDEIWHVLGGLAEQPKDPSSRPTLANWWPVQVVRVIIRQLKKSASSVYQQLTSPAKLATLWPIFMRAVSEQIVSALRAGGP